MILVLLTKGASCIIKIRSPSIARSLAFWKCDPRAEFQPTYYSRPAPVQVKAKFEGGRAAADPRRAPSCSCRSLKGAPVVRHFLLRMRGGAAWPRRVPFAGEETRRA